MNKILQIGFIIFAAACVGIADALIKDTAMNSDNFWDTFRSPQMIFIVVLYIAQVIIFAYLFSRKSELQLVGIVEVAVYALIVLTASVLFFKEKITFVHGTGIVLALAAVALINV